MKTFATLLGSACVVAYSANCGYAADVYGGQSYKDAPTVIAADPVYSWSGPYIGASAGFGVGQSENNVTLSEDYEGDEKGDSLPFLPSIDELSGAVYGVHAGYNFQRDRIVFGVEASLNGTDIDGTSTSPGLLGSLIQTETAIDWYATAVARLGIASGKTLFYGFGGVAWAGVDSKASGVLGLDIPGASITLNNNSETPIGWTAGLGIEHALGANWTARVEYAHVDLGSTSSSASVLFDGEETGIVSTHSQDIEFDTIKIGVNYKFPVN
jgi:outer membrane immunogenic protein